MCALFTCSRKRREMFRQAVLALLLVGNAAAFLAPCASRAQLMAQTQSTVATKGRMYMLFGGAEKKKEEGAAGGAKPAGKMNPFDAMSKMNELAAKTNTLTKELAGTFVAGTAMEGKVTVTFTGTQVPIEVKVTDEALAAGAAKLSAALTEAMKEGHNKSVQLQQTKLNEFYEELGLGAAMKEMRKDQK